MKISIQRRKKGVQDYISNIIFLVIAVEFLYVGFQFIKKKGNRWDSFVSKVNDSAKTDKYAKTGGIFKIVIGIVMLAAAICQFAISNALISLVVITAAIVLCIVMIVVSKSMTGKADII